TPSGTLFVVFASNKAVATLRYLFRSTPSGIFHAIVLPRRRNGSCIIVEAPAAVVRGHALEQASPQEVSAFCRDLFSAEFAELASKPTDAAWQPFLTVRNRPWSAERTVLLGRAAYTAHFSIGLDL